MLFRVVLVKSNPSSQKSRHRSPPKIIIIEISAIFNDQKE